MHRPDPSGERFLQRPFGELASALVSSGTRSGGNGRRPRECQQNRRGHAAAHQAWQSAGLKVTDSRRRWVREGGRRLEARIMSSCCLAFLHLGVHALAGLAFLLRRRLSPLRSGRRCWRPLSWRPLFLASSAFSPTGGSWLVGFRHPWCRSSSGHEDTCKGIVILGGNGIEPDRGAGIRLAGGRVAATVSHPHRPCRTAPHYAR